MMYPFQWVVSKVRDWLFYREMRRVKAFRLGEIWVKFVRGNLYAVDGPEGAE